MLTAGRLIGKQVFEMKLGIGRNPGISFCPRVSDSNSASLRREEWEGERGFDKESDNNGLGTNVSGRSSAVSHVQLDRRVTEQYLTYIAVFPKESSKSITALTKRWASYRRIYLGARMDLFDRMVDIDEKAEGYRYIPVTIRKGRGMDRMCYSEGFIRW